MKAYLRWLVPLFVLIIVTLACQTITSELLSSTPTPSPAPPSPTATPLPPKPVEPGLPNPDEPLFVRGKIAYTSPFFLNSAVEPYVLLEDEAGFVARDREFIFPYAGQAIGPVEFVEDGVLRYSLALPSVPQGTFVDLDNNGVENLGVQVFAVAYWSNVWGDPFLEERDGTGWSTGYASTITDPENDDEIIGGTLIVWVPDDQQGFPTGFGTDGLLFTSDDPTGPIPAGYNIVNLDQEPFLFQKEAEPQIDLNEGEVAVNDYSNLSYLEAFQRLYEKVSREYPFTEDKGFDWDGLYERVLPSIERVNNDLDFYRAMRNFTFAIPDGHVGINFDSQVFFEERGGSFGLILAELSDQRIIVTNVLPDTPAQKAGIQPGAEIISWDDKPASQALDDVVPYFGPYSTAQARRLGQLVFLTRYPPDTRVPITYRNPRDQSDHEVTLVAEVEYDSLFASIPSFSLDELTLPVEAEILDPSRLGYIRLHTFSDDYNLMARLWERHIRTMIDEEIAGIILDMRSNSGGNSGLARDFACYFFDRELDVYKRLYYNENSSKFEYSEPPMQIKPGPLFYEGEIAVLIGPDCVSACEGFVYLLSQNDKVTLIGNFPTAGAFGEVGRGQYKIPGGYSMQFPTGRSETMQGELLIEGVGMEPDIVVPVTIESALGQNDTVLQAAIDLLSSNQTP